MNLFLIIFLSLISSIPAKAEGPPDSCASQNRSVSDKKKKKTWQELGKICYGSFIQKHSLIFFNPPSTICTAFFKKLYLIDEWQNIPVKSFRVKLSEK